MVNVKVLRKIKRFKDGKSNQESNKMFNIPEYQHLLCDIHIHKIKFIKFYICKISLFSFFDCTGKKIKVSLGT